ncbi:MAG TPA: transporter substrate-binding domain-containing protein [Pseudoalteromonas prydzensis]|uniref:Transporter substrate-binding domain-containing protein n=1 Tax=Pseudoalteromonas prydzensis TaxID=182141 RepID=A0A7V1CXF1_9GAMM|nr:transporter substrate-binding domain-containing protein [Pseudoalteromonas prydzensis]HEA16113.1 transporter substrate-binding domain-containing protein [Pseudoalteromonas prydzensis]
MFSLGSTFTCTAKATITIFTEQFPPYNFSNKGQLQGINLDIVRTLCELADVECKFELLPWDRAYDLVQKKPLSGLVSTARSAGREELFYWVGPLLSARTFFYRLTSNKHINPTDISQVSAYTLGVVRGNIYEELVAGIGFEKDKNLLTVAHHYEYMNLFFKNKIDLILSSELTLDYQLQQFGHGGKEVVKLVELPLNALQGNYLVFNKEMPIAIVERFNEQLEKLRAVDNLDAYRHRYVK